MSNAADESTRLLVIYLRDHYAGSCAGLAVAERRAKASEHTPLGSTMASISSELIEERGVLVQLLDRFGSSPSRLRDAAARLAAEAGRLKLNGHLLRRSPLSDLVELEGLIAGIQAKQRLWESMSACFGAEALAAPGWTYRALSIQAGTQHDRLVPHHREAAQHAFGDAASGPEALLAGTSADATP